MGGSASVEDPRAAALEDHLVQGSDETHLVPCTSQRMWRGILLDAMGRGKLSRSEGYMGLWRGGSSSPCPCHAGCSNNKSNQGYCYYRAVGQNRPMDHTEEACTDNLAATTIHLAIATIRLVATAIYHHYCHRRGRPSSSCCG